MEKVFELVSKIIAYYSSHCARYINFNHDTHYTSLHCVVCKQFYKEHELLLNNYDFVVKQDGDEVTITAMIYNT